LIAVPCWAASLNGRIVYHNQPIGDAVVTLYSFNPATMTRGAAYGTRTNSNGVYTFPSVPNGDYILTVERNQQRIYQGRLRLDTAVRKDITLSTQ
jgi:hypothetical protein